MTDHKPEAVKDACAKANNLILKVRHIDTQAYEPKERQEVFQELFDVLVDGYLYRSMDSASK